MLDTQLFKQFHKAGLKIVSVDGVVDFGLLVYGGHKHWSGLFSGSTFFILPLQSDQTLFSVTASLCLVHIMGFSDVNGVDNQ